MKSASAKAKGRRLQQEVASRIREVFGLPESDVRPAIMGESGADIKLSARALEDFPYATECKNVEAINIWQSWSQAAVNAAKEGREPLLIFRRNRSNTLAVIEFDHLLELLKGR